MISKIFIKITAIKVLVPDGRLYIMNYMDKNIYNKQRFITI